MSAEEIEQKRQEAEANAAENERRAKLAELKNEADSEIYSAQKLIDDPNFRDKLDEGTRDRIETLILELMDLKGSEDTVSLKLKIKELRDAVMDASSTMY